MRQSVMQPVSKDMKPGQMVAKVASHFPLAVLHVIHWRRRHGKLRGAENARRQIATLPVFAPLTPRLQVPRGRWGRNSRNPTREPLLHPSLPPMMVATPLQIIHVAQVLAQAHPMVDAAQGQKMPSNTQLQRRIYLLRPEGRCGNCLGTPS